MKLETVDKSLDFLKYIIRRIEIRKGKDLIFISQIKRDGTGTIDCRELDMSKWDNTDFVITSLSLSENTCMASEFNSFIVRKK